LNHQKVDQIFPGIFFPLDHFFPGVGGSLFFWQVDHFFLDIRTESRQRNDGSAARLEK